MTLSLKDFAAEILNQNQPLEPRAAFLEAYLAAIRTSSTPGSGPSLVDPDVIKLVVKTANEFPAMTRAFDIINFVAERRPELIDREMAEAVDKAGGMWMSANIAYGTVKGLRPELFPPCDDNDGDGPRPARGQQPLSRRGAETKPSR